MDYVWLLVSASALKRSLQTFIGNANQRANDTLAQSWIKPVPETAGLQQQLATAKSDRDRASIYAKAGLWYDALNALLTAQAANSTDPYSSFSTSLSIS